MDSFGTFLLTVKEGVAVSSCQDALYKRDDNNSKGGVLTERRIVQGHDLDGYSEEILKAYVEGYTSGFHDHPPSSLALSPDPREYDALNADKLRNLLFTYASNSETLSNKRFGAVKDLIYKLTESYVPAKFGR